MFRNWICRAALGVCLAAACLFSRTGASQDLSLPTDPSQWINAPPLTKESLAGKGAFLWFYEEQCPNCRKKWPDLVALAKTFEDKPVVFIAVNSGNPRSSVEHYVRAVGLNWPVIVDTSRELEQAAGLNNPISLDNIYQALYLTPDGKLKFGSFRNLEQTVEQSLIGAKWNLDPTSIPTALRPAWRAIEFGQYSSAALLVKKGMGASKSEMKEAATKLNDFVQDKIQADVQSARSDAGAGNKWRAYQTLENLTRQYAGFELPKDLPNQKKQLMADAQVKLQLTAVKQLESIKRGANAPTPEARKRMAVQLERLVKSSPGTTAAEEAAELLKQLQ